MSSKIITVVCSSFVLGLSLLFISTKAVKGNQIITPVKLISEVKSDMVVNIQAQLYQALNPINALYAQMVADEMTDIEVYPTTFLQDYQIYKVEYFNPHKPVLFYVGFAPEKSAYLLTDSPENYLRLAAAAHVVIDSPQTAIDYVITYLEVTRSPSNLSYRVNSVDAVEFRPHLDDEETKQQQAFLEKYRSVITQPTAKAIANGYVVNAYVVNGQALNQYTITVSRNGQIITDIKILEEDLPLVYGL